MDSNKNNQSNVIIAICTFRRPRELKKLLKNIYNLKGKIVSAFQITILIVDNEGNQESKQVCDSFRNTHSSIQLTYVVETKPGISYARNAVLANIPKHCDFVAMIDDDEIPDEYWLENLLLTQKKSNVAIIRGPIIPVYADTTPKWVIRGSYFGWPTDKKDLQDGQEMESAATNNVLINWQAIKDLNLKFDSSLALTGGEDVVFFQRIRSAGHKIVYSDKAKVYESIPESRITLSALIKLSFRYGSNRLIKNFLRQNSKNNISSLLILIPSQFFKAIKHVAVGIIRMLGKLLLMKFNVDVLGPELLRIARGMGLLFGCFGFKYKYYR